MSLGKAQLTEEVKAERIKIRNKISSSETRLKVRVQDVRDKVEYLKLKHNAIELGKAFDEVCSKFVISPPSSVEQ